MGLIKIGRKRATHEDSKGVALAVSESVHTEYVTEMTDIAGVHRSKKYRQRRTDFSVYGKLPWHPVPSLPSVELLALATPIML